jgi:hypothetical protein
LEGSEFLEFPGSRFLNAAKRINLSIFDFENYFWIELVESNKGILMRVSE